MEEKDLEERMAKVNKCLEENELAIIVEHMPRVVSTRKPKQEENA